MASLSEFISYVRTNSISRQNRFEVSILGTPRILQGIPIVPMLLCKSVNINGVNVSSDPVRYTGEVIEIPYDRTFSGCTLTFYADINLINRKYFEEWVNGIQDRSTRIMTYYDYYITNLEVNVLNVNDVSVYKMDLYECWPKTIGPLMLDNSVNELMTFDVSFEYRYHKTTIMDSTLDFDSDNSPQDGFVF